MRLRPLWLVVLAISLWSSGCRHDDAGPDASKPEDQSDLLGEGAQLVVVDAEGEPDARRARVLAPGQAASLAVQVLDGEGEPVDGARLRFIAPDRPVRGGFDESQGDHIHATVTDGEGIAAATFTATEEGLFAIDVYVDDSLLLESFAVSSWEAAPMPTVPLEEIDAAMPAAVTEVLTDESLVHGPFLLPALTTITVAGAEEPVDATFAPSWFYWIDHEPFAMFEHPTTLVGLHGQPVAEPETCGGRFTRVDANKWPELALPSGEVESLLGPVASNLRLQPESAEPRRAEAPPTVFRANSDDCALVLHGKDFERGAADVAAFFRDTYRAGWVEFRTEKDILADWKGLLAQANEHGCGKLILYMTGHGDEWPARPSFQVTDDDYIYYDDLADELEKHFAGGDVELQIYLSTCFAELMIAELQGHGLHGDVFASSSWWQTTTSTGAIDFVFQLMIQAWDELDDPTLGDAFDHVVETLEAGAPWPGTKYRQWRARRMSPQRAPLDPDYQDWDVPDIELVQAGRNRFELARPPSNSSTAPDGRVLPMRLDFDLQGMPKFKFDIPVGSGDDLLRIEVDDDALGIDASAREPADTAFEQSYTVISHSKYAAYRGTGTVRFADPGPPPPPEIGCTERKEVIQLIAETTVDPAMGITTHTGVATLNDEHEVLVWGGLGQPRYDILNPRCASLCEDGSAIAIADPQQPVPLSTGETPLVTDASYPRRFTDGRAFAFSAWLGGDEHAIVSYRKGRYDVLARFKGPNARTEFTDHLRISSKGSVLWGTHEDAILTDDSMPSQSLFRFTGDCAEWVAEVGYGMPGTAWQYSRLHPEAILADDTVLYTAAADDRSGVTQAEGLYRYGGPDDIDVIVYLTGDPAPVGTGTITSVDFAGATDDGAIVVWLGVQDGDDYRQALVRRDEKGEATELLVNDGLAPLLPVDPPRTAVVTETFVGLDGQVAVIAQLDSAQAPYQRVGSILYLEHRGEMKVAAQEGEPQCGGPWVWSGLVETGVKVWGTGNGTAYLRAYSRPVDGGASELALFRWDSGRLEKVLATGPEGVLLSGNQHRTLTDFGIAGPIDAGSERETEPSRSTNFFGELVLDVQYPPDTSGYLRRGIFLIRG